MPREIVNQIPANMLNIEKITEVLFVSVNRFEINKLNPIIISAEGINTVPKLNISKRVNTNNIDPVRKEIEPITIPVLYCLR